MACACKYDEDEIRTEVCRPCAAALPQTIEDDRGRLQLNPDWLQARCGFATGSRALDITKLVQKKKVEGVVTEWKPSSDRMKYMDHVLAERLTGKPQGIRKVYSLDERRDLEPEARADYAFKYNHPELREVGFIHHPFIDWFGCSPDCLVGNEGMGEIKCLDAANHLKLWEGDESIIEEHKPQVISGLSCTSRNWNDLVFYCPSMKHERLKLFVRRFERDEDEISMLECAVQAFLAEVETRLRAIQNGDSNLLAQLTGSVKMLEKSSVVRPIRTRRKTIAVE